MNGQTINYTSTTNYQIKTKSSKNFKNLYQKKFYIREKERKRQTKKISLTETAGT